MRNKQHKLPTDLVRRWAPSRHSLFPLNFRQVVKAVLMLAAKRKDGTPYYPQTHFYKLPKDVLYLILQYAALPHPNLPTNQNSNMNLLTTRNENDQSLIDKDEHF
jgi:hypothetical protein